MITLRPFSDNDIDTFWGWLSVPEVAKWWRDPSSREQIEKEYGSESTEPLVTFVAELKGEPFGLIQWEWMRDEPDWVEANAHIPVEIGDAINIDYLIGEPDLVGRGLGPQMIQMLIDQLFATEQVARIVSFPLQENPASWKALEKVGFTRQWGGDLISNDPSDFGPAYLYVLDRVRE